MSSHGKLPLSPQRRNMLELMRLVRPIPLVTAERRMDLQRLIDAREACQPRPAWPLLLMKAFAIVAVRRPELRTAFMSYPYRHLHVSPQSVGNLIIERHDRGEPFPIYCRFRHMERTPLAELQKQLDYYRRVPLAEEPFFNRYLWMGRLPGLARRLIWNLGFHWNGKKRAHYFGTFALSTIAGQGAGLASILSPVAFTLHYGLFDERGRLDMRLTFDHRVVDGAPVARALAEMEKVLAAEILTEVKQGPPARAAA